MKYKKMSWFIFALLLSLVFSGCAGKKSTKKDPFFEKWKEMAEKSKGHSPPSKTRIIDLPERIKEVEALEEEAKAYNSHSQGLGPGCQPKSPNKLQCKRRN
jgi:hypothetical protein